MRSESDFNKHKLKVCTCGRRYVLAKKYEHGDLFNKTDSSQITPVQVRCKSYFCPVCSKKKRNELFNRAKDAMKRQTWWMLTLTTVNTYDNRDEMLTEISSIWNRFLVSYKRNCRNLKYIKVLEVGKYGMVHLHVIVNQRHNENLISNLWKRAGGGERIDYTNKLANDKALNYILKYVMKACENTELSKTFYIMQKRRYSFSRSIKFKEIEKKDFILIFNKLLRFSEIEHILKVEIQDGKKDSIDFCLDYLPPPDKDLLSDEINFMIDNRQQGIKI